jgi:hypothetical protein
MISDSHVYLYTDCIVLVDKSGSMKAENRWSHVRKRVGSISNQVSLYNQAGADVCFFSKQTEWIKNVKSVSKVNALFEAHIPESDLETNTSLALRESFNKHFYRHKKNPDQNTHIYLFTDDVPTDNEDIVRMFREVTIKTKDRNEQLKIAVAKQGFLTRKI